MTIESNELFELCKQVYEATGWENTKDGFFDGGEVMPFTDRIGAYIGASNFQCPLYTSDYLLEKLPNHIYLQHYADGTWHASQLQPTELRTAENAYQSINASSATPLKALLKLTLELREKML